jgi:hypothetical protein
MVVIPGRANREPGIQNDDRNYDSGLAQRRNPE